MAKTKSINVWGDGNDVKDFMYVEDFCEIALRISQKSKKSMTINIASGNNITIKEILKKLIIATKHSPKINFDLSKPQMIKFRKISVTKMRKFLSNKIKLTKFEIGLKKTLEWYNNDYK